VEADTRVRQLQEKIISRRGVAAFQTARKRTVRSYRLYERKSSMYSEVSCASSNELINLVYRKRLSTSRSFLEYFPSKGRSTRVWSSSPSRSYVNTRRTDLWSNSDTHLPSFKTSESDNL